MTFSSSSNDDDVMYIYKMALTLLGVWPFQKTGFRRIIHVVLIYLSQITTIIPECLNLFSSWGNLDAVIENLTCNVMINMVNVKLTTMLIHKDRMARCINSTMNDVRDIEDEESRVIMKKHHDLGRIVWFSLLILLFTTFLFYIMLSIVMTISTDCSVKNVTGTCKVFPIPSSYLIDTDSSPTYQVIFFTQIIEGSVSCTANFAVDSFMFFLAMHLGGQLELLKRKFRDLAEIVDRSKPNPNLTKFCQKMIKAMTKRHLRLINFSQDLEETFNLMLLVQLFVSSVMICITGFQLIFCLENGDLLCTGKNAVYMSAVMMQLLMYSYAGDYLRSQSLALAYAAYETRWYDLPPSVARDLLFVMIRAGKPLRISAGKFFVMTLESFKVIVKSSSSYLSMLRVMVK